MPHDAKRPHRQTRYIEDCFPLYPALTFVLRYTTCVYYVYVLINETEELYIGSTNDLRKRLAEHNKGRSLSTRKHIWTLVYYEAYRSKEDARNREHQLKYHGQAKAQLKRRISASLQTKVSAGQV